MIPLEAKGKRGLVKEKQGSVKIGSQVQLTLAAKNIPIKPSQPVKPISPLLLLLSKIVDWGVLLQGRPSVIKLERLEGGFESEILKIENNQ